MAHESVFKKKWDVAVIGSGVGGLLTGALLAKRRGLRVLVLEKHYQIGGCTHSFQRKKNYFFDVGVHYVGAMGPSSLLKIVLDEVTNGRLKWKPLPPVMDHVYLPDAEYSVPVKLQETVEYLSALFPDEAQGIEQAAHEVQKIAEAHTKWQSAELTPPWMETLSRKWWQQSQRSMFQPIDDVLRKFIRNPRVRLLFTRRWPALGLKPNICHSGYFAADANYFMEGAWYPSGGGEQIAIELAQTILDFGGQIATKTNVEKIIVEGGQARGVVADGQKIEANLVISGVGAWTTYHQFLSQDDSRYFHAVNKNESSVSYVMAFMTLKCSPRALGIDSGNHWIFAGNDYPAFFPNDPELEFLHYLWIGSPSLKRESPYHTLEFATIAPIEAFQKWHDSHWHKRPEDYLVLKQKLYEAMMFVAETRFPGVRDAVEFYEVSTPLTVEHFVTKSATGLGIPATPARLHMPWAKSSTPIRNLYLTGADTFAWGISGAMAGAIKTYKLATHGRKIRHFSSGIEI